MADRCFVSRGCVLLLLFGPAIFGAQCAAAQSCPVAQCSGDFNCDGRVTVDEILRTVKNALDGCPPGLTNDQACSDYAVAQCAKLDQCVVNGTTSRYGGTAICQVRQKDACLARLRAPGTGNNAAAVELCVQELPTGSCTDFDLGNLPECMAKIGTRADGQPCAFAGQCESSNCAIATGTNCGVCAEASQPGESCAAASCSHGFACVKATQLCQPRGVLDGNCDADHPCGAGLSCVTPSGAPSGTCQVAGNTLGAPCDPQRESAPACDPNFGLYCDGATHTCQAVTYAAPGGQCGVVKPLVVNCTNDSTCFGAQGQTPGMCVANAADGMACDTLAGPSCVPPAQCVTGSASATAGTCQLPDASACG